MDDPRSLTFLNSQGDFTFIWGPEDDSNVMKIIAKKIDLGIDFFIIGKQPYNKLVPTQNLIKDPDDIKDKDFKSFILNSYAEAAKTQFTNLNESILCKDAELISQHQSLAIIPIHRKE